MNSSSLASDFYALACDAGLSSSFQSLAPLLLNQSGLSFEQTFGLRNRQGEIVEEAISIKQAFWHTAISESVDAYNFKRRFFTPETAAFITSVCPDFWQLGEQGLGLFEAIAQLSKAGTDFPANFQTQYFRGERQTNNGDAWLAWAIEQMPSSTFSSKAAEAAWEGLLRMGSEQGLLAFVAKRPDAWSIADAKGRPAFKGLAQHLKQATWTAFLESGQDPKAPLGSRPLWRALLPAEPSSGANSGTLRKAIEDWLLDEHKQGGLDEEGERYLLTVTFNELFPRTLPAHRSLPSINQTLELLSKLPPSWVWATPPRKQLPAFMVFLGSTTKNKEGKTSPGGMRWVEAFQKNQSWKQALGPSGEEIVQIAAAMLSNQSKLLPATLSPATLTNAHLDDFVKKLAGLAKSPAEPWQSWLKAQRLEHTLAASSKEGGRRQPRL